MEKNFYIMLVSPSSWGGPSVKIISEPETRTNRGKMVDEIEGEFSFQLIVEKKVDNLLDLVPLDAHETAKSTLFSLNLVNLLKEIGVDNIQYFKADFTYEPTGKTYDYSVANIIGVISALDMNKSDVVLSRKGKVLEIEKMSLDESRIQEQKIFRLRESIMHIVVHKSIKDAIEAASITGLKFVKDDEYEPGML